MKKKNKNKKSSAEKLAEELLIEADQLRQITENTVREQLAGMFAPNVKKAMSQVIMEGKGYKNEEEHDGEEELSNDDLEDLERALEEGDDDEWEEEELSEEDGGEGADSEDVSDEEWDEEEDMDEADYSDEIEGEDEEDAEDLEEGDGIGSVDAEDYDFIEELREILEAEDEEEEDVDFDDLEDLDEGEDGGSYTEKAPKVKMDEEEGGESEGGEEAEDLDEGEDGGSYTEKAPKVKMDEDMEKILDENKRLKSSLRKAIKSMKEATLDSKKMEVIDRIIEERQVSDKGRIRITSAIDKAKNERDLVVLESTIKRQYPKRKKSVKESKKRSLANKSRSQKSTRKSKKAEETINENKTIGGGFADRLAEIAGI